MAGRAWPERALRHALSVTYSDRVSTSRKKTVRTGKKPPKTVSTIAPALNPRDALLPGENLWVLTCNDWDMRGFLKSHGARYFPEYGWAYLGESLPDALRPYLPARHSWDAFVAHSLIPQSAPRGNPNPDARTGTITLRSDQEEDVATIVAAYRRGAPEFLNASLVGAGKTVTSIAAAKRIPGVRRILVLCPLGAIPAWRRTIDDMGDGGKEWVLLNYQSTKKLLTQPAAARAAKKQSTKNQRTVSHGAARAQFDLVIRDESQWCADPSSQQTRAVDKAIAGPAGTHPALVMSVSATPCSDPSQASYLHRGLAWRTGQPVRAHITTDEYVAWCKRYGLGVEHGIANKLTWVHKKTPEAHGPDIRKLNHLIFGAHPPWALRRVPDWPEQQRFETPIELSPQEREAYDVEWSAFAAAMRALDAAQKHRESVTRSGERAQERAAATRLENARKAARDASVRYQQKAGLLRGASTAEYIALMVDKGFQVAVSCQHLAVVDDLRERLERRRIPTATFTGQNVTDREGERVRFQQGDATVILFTTAEALNLHAGETAVGGNNVPRVTVVAQPRWSPRQAVQVEGRGQRNGTAAPCYYLYAVDTIEEHVLRTVLPAMRNTLAIVGDDTTSIGDLARNIGLPLVTI